MRAAFAIPLVVLLGCGGREQAAPAAMRPSILLITLDTTRADAMGTGADRAGTEVFDAIAGRGRLFRQAYATVPETLPSHTSMMSGLYPAGHGIHENARYVPASVPLLAEQLQKAGYRTSAFVSAFVLDRRFGLARGFDVYDDGDGRWTERNARETTDAAIAELTKPPGADAQGAKAARFVWVHYYDAHAPYAAPVAGGTDGDARARYLREVGYVDAEMGRLWEAFVAAAGQSAAVIVAGDHGEGLGEHGEAEHGHLLYQSTMHVPLAVAGPGVSASQVDTPVSTRRVYHTILDWAGLGSGHSLRGPASNETVLGEAMKPFLEYGWQPQVMAVADHYKSILAGPVETFDLRADPGETRNLGSAAPVPAGMRKALEDYPMASPAAAPAPANLDDEAKRRLAALGYVSAGTAPVVRKDAPRPADMTAMLPLIERASALFTAAQYERAIPLLEQIAARDPFNLDARLRLATSFSSLGRQARAEEVFAQAAAIAPKSQDVRTYLALHYARTPQWERAVPLLEQVVAESPDRLTAVEALASLKGRQGSAAMDRADTAAAIAAFERSRQLAPSRFTRDLELGVLYLAARRFEDARTALDRVLAAKPDEPMALFKRAQVSVLLNEPDRAARIERARAKADAETRPLIEREQLFRR